MIRMVKIPFGKHLPDQPALGNPGTPYLKNVIPAAGFLRPFADLNPYSDALSARAQGAITGKESSGNVYTFAGDAGKLYKLTGQAFADVSKLATTYLTPASGHWEFVPWSDTHLLALNGVDAIQVIDPSIGANFADLTGSPPAAKHGAIAGSFVFVGNWAGNEDWVAWCALDNVEEWNTDGTNQSDRQRIPASGPVMRIFGGEVAIVFCQSSIHRFSYAGSPVYWARDEVAPGVGLLASGAAAQFGSLIFFIGQNSFYKMSTNGVAIPIGESRWNKTFYSELDENNADKISSAIDPINTIWLVAYPSTASPTGLPDRVFMYNWATDDCAFVDIDTEFLLSAFAPGISLDDLETETGFDLDSLPFSLDSRVWQGGSLVLSAFDRDHMLGFFSGSNLEAEVSTVERDVDGRRLYVGGARPLVDAADAQIAIRTREHQHAPEVQTAFSSIGPDGLCPQHVEGRYVRARLRMPAGSSWTKAQGVEAFVDDAGEI